MRNICIINNCGKFVHGNGLCNKHYEYKRKYGDPLFIIVNPTPEQRYHSSYTKKGANECWLWCKGLSQDGYGKFSITNDGIKKTLVSSRYGWELLNGKIPEGMLICHSCDTPACQNPRHLFLGTPKTNMVDKVLKNRLVPNPYKDKKTGRFTFKPS